MSERVSFVLAEDHAVVRHGLRLLLEREPGFAVVGETADGLEAVALVERLQPQVLIVDLVLPGLGGLDVTREVVQRWPRTRVIVLSMQSAEAFVLRALRNGASAYVLKEATAEHLGQAIREALAGRRYLSPPLSENAVQALLAKAQSTAVEPYDTLTRREREVLHLCAEGLSNPQVGARLGISPRTAETHRTHVMEKLGLRSRAELITYAVKRGLLAGAPGPPGFGGAGD